MYAFLGQALNRGAPSMALSHRDMGGRPQKLRSSHGAFCADGNQLAASSLCCPTDSISTVPHSTVEW
jgi:hypothetical protein